jgi:hypothetical protein
MVVTVPSRVAKVSTVYAGGPGIDVTTGAQVLAKAGAAAASGMSAMLPIIAMAVRGRSSVSVR